MGCNEHDGRNGLSFWKVTFIFVASYLGIVAAIETGVIEPSFFRQIEKSFDDFNAEKHKQKFNPSFDGATVQPACGRPIILNEPTPLVAYSREFLSAAGKEAEEVKARAPHLMQMIADYRNLRRAEVAK